MMTHSVNQKLSDEIQPRGFSIHTQDPYVPSAQAVAHPAHIIHWLREELLLFHAGVDLLVNDDR